MFTVNKVDPLATGSVKPVIQVGNLDPERHGVLFELAGQREP